MITHIFPDRKKRPALPELTRADVHMCWTCKTCLSECPVNITTNRLQPLKIVRMKVLGMVDEMVILPEIWYCLTCRRCSEVCPMSVKPFLLIDFLRQEALRRGIATYRMTRLYDNLLDRFHRARWFTARDCRSIEGHQEHTPENWKLTTKTPASIYSEQIQIGKLPRSLWPNDKEKPNISVCLTCGECCSVCPVFYDGEVFSPMKILRMAVFGLFDELLNSPSIWLCIGCGRCADACSQKISICQIILSLQQAAVESRIVDSEYSYRFQYSSKPLFMDFTDEVDKIFQKIEQPEKRAAKLPAEFTWEESIG